MGFDAVRRLPLKTFWMMHRNIDRIEAKRDMRAMSVAMVAQSTPDTARAFREELVIEAGTIIKLGGPTESPLDAKRDEAGFAELKMMAGQKIGS
ncbi:hypothetical protein [Duganella sp. FT27W]|uniref:hypothetical protein n=1 Tax=Duganella sp. FT27W TaxID=2654636 RepID=UPI00128BC1CA|nr:hypothetical protein [Duganella sp. FT27W]MPQ56305.1 hypothetical protein [Duganella sp. FT27W]